LKNRLKQSTEQLDRIKIFTDEYPDGFSRTWREKKFTRPADPLALVCYWRKTNALETLLGYDVATSYEYARTLEGDVYNLGVPNKPHPAMDQLLDPDEESLELAKEIRSYYLNKISYRTFMTDREPSDFYKLVNEFFSMPIGTFTEHHIGVIVKLPELYEEDLEYDDLEETYTSHDNIEDGVKDLRLFFERCTILRRGKRRYRMYWLTTESKKHLYVLPVEHRNYLTPFIDKAIKSPVNITGYVNKYRLHPQSNFHVGRITEYYLND